MNTLLWPALKYRLQNQLQTTFLTPFLHWKLTKHDFHHCLYCSNNLNLCNIHHLLEQCDMKLVTCRPTFLFYKWNDLLESFSLNLVIINGAEEFSKVYIISLICAFSRQLRSYICFWKYIDRPLKVKKLMRHDLLKTALHSIFKRKICIQKQHLFKSSFLFCCVNY